MKNDLQSILNQANQTNDKQEKKSLEQQASNLQLEIEGVKSSLQSFKIFAGMCESTPQLILQCSLSMKRNPKDWFEKIFQELWRYWPYVNFSTAINTLTKIG